AFKLYRQKLVTMNRRHGFRVLACIPRRWEEDYLGIQGEDRELESEYQLVVRHAFLNWRIWGPKRFHLFFLSPLLARDVRRFEPDILHVDAEPYSLLACEVALLRRWVVPQAKLIVHASQNIVKLLP